MLYAIWNERHRGCRRSYEDSGSITVMVEVAMFLRDSALTNAVRMSPTR